MPTSFHRLRRIRNNVGVLLHNNMFVRWMAAFSTITVISIAVFSYFLFSYMSNSLIAAELENQEKAIERVSEYLENRYDFVQTFMNNIYRDNSLSYDMVSYLRLNFEDYMMNRLDQSYDISMAAPVKITEHLKNTLQDNQDIQHILLYSAERQSLHQYSQDRNPLMFHTNAALSYIPDVMAMESSTVSAPNVWICKTARVEGELISMRVSVNDPRSLLNIGQLLFYFRSDPIDNIVSSYQDKLRGYIVVMSLDGQVFYDSSNRYYGKRFPYLDKINSPNNRERPDGDSYYTVASRYPSGFIVAGIAPVEELKQSYQGLKRMIIAISSVCILIVVVLPSIVVINFAKRMYKIIRFMRKAEKGDLSARLPVERDDELGQISRGFNSMMEKLSRHIEHVYKAEIKQKHTELTALQARVQPHFLYNTLEVIRMRAVASGVSDVADMIYSLAMLFKNLVRPEYRTSLQDELENSRLYLELFRIRYKDHFSYSIEYEPSLGQVPVVRMLLQPIIENYIVHGLRMDRNDNIIAVRVFRRADDVVIEISDNGKGMSEQKAAEITELLQRHEDDGRSFGLRSVHQRLELLYGPSYGLTLTSRAGETVITLTLPTGRMASGEMTGS